MNAWEFQNMQVGFRTSTQPTLKDKLPLGLIEVIGGICDSRMGVSKVKEADFLICGCGIIGLTIAKELFYSDKFRRVALDESRKYIFKYFFNDVQGLGNDIIPEDIEDSSKVGIRPQLVDWEKKELVMDFKVIKKDDSLHILNAISPAFTCSMSFAGFIVDKYLS